MTEISNELLDIIKDVAGMKPVLNELIGQNRNLFTRVKDLEEFRWKWAGVCIAGSGVLSFIIVIITIYHH